MYTYVCVCVFRCCLTLDLQIQESIQQATLEWFPTKGPRGGHPINRGCLCPFNVLPTPRDGSGKLPYRFFTRWIRGRSAAWPGWELQYTDSWCVCFCLRYLCICWIYCVFIHVCMYVCIYVTIFMYMHVMMKYGVYIYTHTRMCIISIFIISSTVSMFFFTCIGPLMIDFRDHRSGGTRHSSLQHHCQRSAKSWARQPQGSKRNGRNPERLFGSVKKSPKLGGFGSWWNDKMNWYTHTTQKQSQRKTKIYLFPRKHTCPWKDSDWKTTLLSKWPLFRGHVRFRWCSVELSVSHQHEAFFEASASAGWHSTVHRSCMENHMNFNMGRKQKYWSFLGSTWKTIQETWFSWRNTCMENQSCQGSDWFQVTSQWNPGNCKQLTSWSDTSRSHAG